MTRLLFSEKSGVNIKRRKKELDTVLKIMLLCVKGKLPSGKEFFPSVITKKSNIRISIVFVSELINKIVFGNFRTVEIISNVDKCRKAAGCHSF